FLPAFFFSSRRRHTRFSRDWSSDVCSSDLSRRPWPPRRVERELMRRGQLLRQTGAVAKVGGWELDPVAHEMEWTEELYRIYERRSEERRVGKVGRHRCTGDL